MRVAVETLEMLGREGTYRGEIEAREREIEREAWEEGE